MDDTPVISGGEEKMTMATLKLVALVSYVLSRCEKWRFFFIDFVATSK